MGKRISSNGTWRGLALIAIVLLLAAATQAAIIRVDGDSGNDANGGTDWTTDAMATIQGALNVAGANEIWVKGGTAAGYGFIGINEDGEEIYGGFDGTETVRADRDPDANVTVIDATGAIHALTMNGRSNVIVDGLTITGGNANSGTGDSGKGGGVFLRLCDDTNQFVNCVIDNNASHFLGGAGYLEGSSPKFIDCEITNNQAIGAPANGNYGGGFYITKNGGTFSSPEFDGCLIDGNSAVTTDPNDGGSGGFFYVYNPGADINPTAIVMTDCVISNNVAGSSSTDPADSMYGGAIGMSKQPLEMTRCVFTDNAIVYSGSVDQTNLHGGALYFNDCDSLTMTDCEFYGNNITVSTMADMRGGAVFIQMRAEPTSYFLTGCVFQGNYIEMNSDGAGDILGGAIYMNNGRPRVTDCQINANYIEVMSAVNPGTGSYYRGAGVFCQNSLNARFTDCDFLGNYFNTNPANLSNRRPEAPALQVGNSTRVQMTGCNVCGNENLDPRGRSGAIATYTAGASSWITITSSTLVGNRNLGTAGAFFVDYNTAGVWKIENSLFIGNSGQNGGAMQIVGGASSGPQLINCTFVGNRHHTGTWGGSAVTLYKTGGGSRIVPAVNCIFADNRGSHAIREYSNGDVYPIHGLFYNNASDFANIGTGAHVGAADINANVNGAELNVDTQPRFWKGPMGYWTADGVYDAATGLTTLTDANAALTPGELAGMTVNPNDNSPGDAPLYAYIVSNTATQIVVAGDFSATALQDLQYQVMDFHLRANSGAIDQGKGVAGASHDAPATEGKDGVARTTDHPDIANQTSSYDIGAYEFEAPGVVASPQSLDFGQVIAGEGPSAPQSVQIANAGISAFTGLTVNVVGATADYDVTIPSLPSPMSTGASVQVDVAFDPQTPGRTKVAHLVITSDETDTPLVVPLNGDAGGVPIHVDGDAGDDGNDGSSWLLAKATIQGALNSPGGSEIWVKGGTAVSYGAIAVNDNDEKIYGGFAGTETVRGGRDPAANETIVDAAGGFHCVTMTGRSGTTIDGLTITGAVADSGSGNDSKGGGLFMVLCDNTNEFVNCKITGNSATFLGGAGYLEGSSPQFTDCEITNNQAIGNVSNGNYGGAFFMTTNGGTFSTPGFTRCLISGNSAVTIHPTQSGRGGFIYNYNAGSHNPNPIVMTDCVVSNNTCGGASSTDNRWFTGGAITAQQQPYVITGCTFEGNSATYTGTASANVHGGAIFSNVCASFTIEDTEFVGNVANSTQAGGNLRGGAVYMAGTAIDTPYFITDCSFEANGVEFVGATPTAMYGGAVYFENGWPRVTGTTFDSNYLLSTCDVNPGSPIYNMSAGLHVQTSTDAQITNCDFLGNSLEYTGSSANTKYRFNGPAACFTGTCYADMTGCVFAGNRNRIANSNGRGGAVGTETAGTGQRLTFNDCQFVGNASSGPAGALFIDYCPAGIFKVYNCVFAGNTGQNGGAIQKVGAGGTMEIVNTTFVGNRHHTSSWGGSALTYYKIGGQTVLPVVNCIFADHENSRAIQEYGGTQSAVYPINCLFNGNSHDFNNSGTGAEDGAAAINANVDGAADNVDGYPAFWDGPVGHWTKAPAYDAATNRTWLTDRDGAFTPGELVGKVVSPTDVFAANLPRYAYITSNTATAVAIVGDVTGWVSRNDAYEIKDFHLRGLSGAIDQGIDSAGATHSAPPAQDIDGDARVDAPRVPNFSTYDIGAYEFDGPGVVADPEGHDFGLVLPGDGPTAMIDIDVGNQGLGAFTGLSILAVGDVADFDIAIPGALPDPMALNTTTTVQAAFNPQTGGHGKEVALVITSDETDMPLIVSLTGDAGPADIRVDNVLGNDDNAGDTWGTAKQTIADALGEYEGNRIWLKAGTWPLSGVYGVEIAEDDESLLGGFDGTELVLADRADPPDPSLTVLDGQGATSKVIYLEAVSNVLIDGLTITGGAGSDYGGGVNGQDLDGTSSIENCAIAGNSANVEGGGVYLDQATLALVNCSIVDNQVVSDSADAKGAGVYVNPPSSTTEMFITNCDISSNTLMGPAGIHGGGIFVNQGYPRIGGSEINNNLMLCTGDGDAGWVHGGALFVQGSGDARIADSQFLGNRLEVTGGATLPMSAAVNMAGSSTHVSFTGCVMAGNVGGRGGAVSAGFYSDAVSQLSFTSCTLVGNTAQYGGAVFFDYCLRGAWSIVNTAFVGNATSRYGGAVAAAVPAGSLEFVNCGFMGNRCQTANPGNWGGSAVCINRYSGGMMEIPLVNCVVTDNRNDDAIREYNAADKLEIFPINSLFHNNPMGDFYDLQGGGPLDGAAAINANVTGAAANIDGAPAFVGGPSGNWDAAPGYDADTNRTTFTDSTAAFTPGALVGQTVNPNDASPFDTPLYGYITANTATTIEVAGDFRPTVTGTEAYQVMDFNLSGCSAAIDQGTDVASGGSSVPPTLDIDGVDRSAADPSAIANASSSYDIGPYEFDGPIVHVDPLALDFGTTIVHLGPTPSQFVEIANVGVGDLNFTDVDTSGTDKGEFNIVTLPSLAPLAAGDPAREVELNFDPDDAPGTFTAALDITTNDSCWATTSVQLDGVGVANEAPVFVAAVIEKKAAQVAVEYGLIGETLDGSATDGNSAIGDRLTFSVVPGSYSSPGGSDWLGLAATGELSGTPLQANLGTNTWDVKVEDELTSSDQAQLVIEVIDAPPGSSVDWWRRY